MAHQLWLALGADHEATAILLLERQKLGEDLLVLIRRQPLHSLATPRRNEEIEVERDRTLLRRPAYQVGKLVSVPLGEAGLDDEVQLVLHEAVHRGKRPLERPCAVAEAIVIRRAQRVHAHRHAPHACRLQRLDALMREADTVRAHHDRSPRRGGALRDGFQVVAQQGLAPTENQEHRRVHRYQLVENAEALAGGQLTLGPVPGPGRDVAV